MTPVYPLRSPRTTELLLEALIVDPSMRDAVLGDLTEEWAERVDRDGPVAANRWYRWQAIRALPYLIRQWYGAARWTAILAALTVPIVVRVVTLLVGGTSTAATVMVFQYLEVSPLLKLVAWGAIHGLVGFLGGAVVVRLVTGAPLPAVLWFTVATVLTTVTMDAFTTAAAIAPAWYVAIQKAAEVPATMLGAIWQLRRSARRRQHARQLAVPVDP